MIIDPDGQLQDHKINYDILSHEEIQTIIGHARFACGQSEKAIVAVVDYCAYARSMATVLRMILNGEIAAYVPPEAAAKVDYIIPDDPNDRQQEDMDDILVNHIRLISLRVTRDKNGTLLPILWRGQRCPFCHQHHEHSQPDGHRAAHCPPEYIAQIIDIDGQPHAQRDGYIVLTPGTKS